MKDNPLLKLRAFGQSIWLDYISRHMINSGELQSSSKRTASGGDLQPLHLRQGHCRQPDYDDAIRAPGRAGNHRRDLSDPHCGRRPAGRRPVPAEV